MNPATCQPARWARLALLAASSVLIMGLALTVAAISYDLANWSTVYEITAETAASRNGLADLGGQVIGEAIRAVAGLTAVGLHISLVGVARGRTWAFVATGVLATPYALCCGAWLVDGGGRHSEFDNPQHINARASYAPDWLLLSDVVGPLAVFGAAAVTVALCLLIVALCRR
jgi:hypothetical protein